MGIPAKAPIGSRWKANKGDKVWVVIGRRPGGHTDMQEEGKPRFMECYLQDMLKQNTRLPDLK